MDDLFLVDPDENEENNLTNQLILVKSLNSSKIIFFHFNGNLSVEEMEKVKIKK